MWRRIPLCTFLWRRGCGGIGQEDSVARKRRGCKVCNLEGVDVEIVEAKQRDGVLQQGRALTCPNVLIFRA